MIHDMASIPNMKYAEDKSNEQNRQKQVGPAFSDTFIVE